MSSIRTWLPGVARVISRKEHHARTAVRFDNEAFMLDVPESISQMVDRTNRAELIADVIASDEAMGEFRESGTTLFNLTNGDN